MPMPARSRASYVAVSLAIPVVVIVAAWLAVGRLGVCAAVLVSILWTTVRFDTRNGMLSIFALAILLVVTIPALLLMLLAVTHR